MKTQYTPNTPSESTPGPWEDGGNSEVIKIQQAVTLQTIAFIKPGYPMNKANARLIAAAPELLEVCKILLKLACKYCDTSHLCFLQNGFCVEHKQAKQAIEKAEG